MKPKLPRIIGKFAARRLKNNLKAPPVAKVGLKAADYAQVVAVSLRQARRDLSELEELGLLERSGKGPATIYRQMGKAANE